MTPTTSGIPIVGGPWDGGLFWGGCPNEEDKVITLRGGYYRVHTTRAGELILWWADT